MKAVVCTRYGGPEVLQLQEVEKPEPKDKELCVKIFATAVTSSDCIVRGFKVPLGLRLPMALAIGFRKPRKAILGMVLAGAVGTSAAQLAAYFGAEVTAVCSTLNLDFVRSLGAAEVLDYTKEEVTGRWEVFDFIFDAVGKRKSSKLKQQWKGVLSEDGRYVSVDDATPQVGIADMRFLKDLAEAGRIKPVIDRRYRLEQIVEAYRYVDTGHKRGNVIIIVDPASTNK